MNDCPFTEEEISNIKKLLRSAWLSGLSPKATYFLISSFMDVELKTHKAIWLHENIPKLGKECLKGLTIASFGKWR